MKPNLEKVVEILASKLAQSEMQSAQWQSVADDLNGEKEQLQQEIANLKREIGDRNTPHIDDNNTPHIVEK